MSGIQSPLREEAMTGLAAGAQCLTRGSPAAESQSVLVGSSISPARGRRNAAAVETKLAGKHPP
jgi:hypothetical protein